MTKEPDQIDPAHTWRFRHQRARAEMTMDIMMMDRANFEAFRSVMDLGNSRALPYPTLELTDLEDPLNRHDGWAIISAHNGSLAGTTAAPLPLSDEHGASLGEALRFADRAGDLWAYLVFRRDGDPDEAYQARRRKALIDLTIADLGTLADARMANAPGDGDGGVPWSH